MYKACSLNFSDFVSKLSGYFLSVLHWFDSFD